MTIQKSQFGAFSHLIDLSEKLWCRRDSNPGPLGLAETLTVRSAKTVKKIAEWSEACCREALKWPYLS